MKYLSILALLVLASCSTASNQQSPRVTKEKNGRVTNLNTVGNLGKSHELPCISLSEAKNAYTPPDLFSSSAKCVTEGRDKDAAQVFFLASAYGVYDGMRVNDPSAAQARQVLVMNNFDPIDEAQKEGLQKEMDKIAAGQSPEINELCEGIALIGQPDYKPQYMILHGMAAFTGIQGDGLKPNYDADANWAKVLSSLKCP